MSWFWRILGALAAPLLVTLLTGGARAQISGAYVHEYFPPDPVRGDTERPDLIAITNAGANRILSFGMYLSQGADTDGNGLGLFFDTVAPSAQAPPSGAQAQPGYDGAARLWMEPASASRVGYVPGSEMFVFFPGTLSGPDGDGAVQLVTIACDHFDPGETILLGIDVDGFDDFLGIPSEEGPPPAGMTIAAGQSIVDGEGQVYFDIVSGEAPDPVAVPVRTPWIALGAVLVAMGWSSRIRTRRGARFW